MKPRYMQCVAIHYNQPLYYFNFHSYAIVGYRPPIWFPLDLVLCKRCLFMGRNVKTETKGCAEEEQNGLGLVIKIFPSICLYLKPCIKLWCSNLSQPYKDFLWSFSHLHLFKCYSGIYFNFKNEYSNLNM